MGRLQPSIGQPPASFRKAARAKKAKATINQLIPSLLPTHPRARRGIEAAELILNQGPVKQTSVTTQDGKTPATASGPRITLRVADTLTAARALVTTDTSSRVAILNMASPLTPGGGFLNGASSQEETLCMRTTLLPSLQDGWYRLPELGAIYTPDVLVFREGDGDEVLGKGERWFVDCVTAAMLRNPETERDEDGRGRYVDAKDREMALGKMRMVMRVCQAKGVKRVALGAWGCGAYGNPVGEVAAAWRKVLLPASGGKKKAETWEGVEEVVFAIRDGGMADAFEEAFGEGLTREEVESGDEDGEGEEEEEDDAGMAELQGKIAELRLRIDKTTSPQLKQGLALVLAGMESQVAAQKKE